MEFIAPLERNLELEVPMENSRPDVTLGGGYGRSQMPFSTYRACLSSVLSLRTKLENRFVLQTTMPDFRRLAEKYGINLSQVCVLMNNIVAPSRG